VTNNQLSSKKWENCQALLFDKDGTLLNFRLMWLSWCREVIQAMSPAYQPGDIEQCLSAWGVDLALGSIEPDGHLAIGSTADLQQSLCGKMLDKGICSANPGEEVLQAMQQAYRLVEEKKLVQVIDGVGEAIKELHRKGYILAVVTTDDAAKALDNLKTLGLENYFSAVLGCDMVKNCKPAPDLVFEACRILGVKLEDTAVIGDTVADMLMGQAAGTACNIGVASGVTSPADLAGHADIVLESAAWMVKN
jgi:phosphoglycolate phosphatase